MNIRPSKTAFTEAEHAALRAQVAKVKAQDDLSQADIARESEIPDSTLSQYLNDRYPNETGKAEAAAKLNRWLIARAQAAQYRRRGAVAPTFQSLQGSEEIASQLAGAREMAGLVMIAGAPGVGKTVTAKQYAADHPRTWYACMDGTTSGAPTMLIALLEAVGVTEAKGSPQGLKRRLLSILTEAKSLLIVDEAQHLSTSALEVLRAVYDAGEPFGLGVAIMGNELAYTRVGTAGTKAEFAQVSSRFDDRQYIAAPPSLDASALAKAWADVNGEIITKRELEFAELIASKPGGLRNVHKTMKQAIVAARGAQQPLSIEHLQGAFTQLSGRSFLG